MRVSRLGGSLGALNLGPRPPGSPTPPLTTGSHTKIPASGPRDWRAPFGMKDGYPLGPFGTPVYSWDEWCKKFPPLCPDGWQGRLHPAPPLRLPPSFPPPARPRPPKGGMLPPWWRPAPPPVPTPPRRPRVTTPQGPRAPNGGPLIGPPGATNSSPAPWTPPVVPGWPSPPTTPPTTPPPPPRPAVSPARRPSVPPSPPGPRSCPRDSARPSG